MGKLKFLLLDSTNEPQRCSQSLDPQSDQEGLLTFEACLVQRRGHPAMATGACTSHLRIPDEQQKSRVRVRVKDTDSPHVSRVATRRLGQAVS